LHIIFLYNVNSRILKTAKRTYPDNRNPSRLQQSSMEGNLMDIIKVSGKSRTAAVAGAIAGVVREHQHAEVQAIGASAINQAVKAMALAKNYLMEDGYAIVFIPEFVDVDIEGKVRTAIRFVVEPR
jgi:stage V sporulation protein S